MISQPKRNRDGRFSKRGRTGMSRMVFDQCHDINAPERSWSGFWEIVKNGEVLARSKQRICLQRWYRSELREGAVEIKRHE